MQAEVYANIFMVVVCAAENHNYVVFFPSLLSPTSLKRFFRNFAKRRSLISSQTGARGAENAGTENATPMCTQQENVHACVNARPHCRLTLPFQRTPADIRIYPILPETRA